MQFRHSDKVLVNGLFEAGIIEEADAEDAVEIENGTDEEIEENEGMLLMSVNSRKNDLLISAIQHR